VTKWLSIIYLYDDDDLHADIPASERIPMVLMEPFAGKGHVLYTDNFYTSPVLANHFLANNTHLCGTIKKNRKNFQKILSPKILKRAPLFFTNAMKVK